MINITWEQYDKLVEELGDLIKKTWKEHKEFKLFGVPRGGVLLALLLSYKDPEAFSIGIVSNYPEHLTAPTVLSGIKNKKYKAVIVDDILETGTTRMFAFANLVKEDSDFPVIPWAVLIDKSYSYEDVAPADLSCQNTDSSEWVLFPYEDQESEKEREEKHKLNTLKKLKGLIDGGK